MNNYPSNSNFQRYQNQGILAVDYGEKVTGIASFIPGNDPFPLMGERIIFKNQKQLANQITQVVKNDDISLIVIGVPHLLDGKSTAMTEKILKFARKLSEQTGVPVYGQDETLSTKSAEDRMKNSPEFDFKVDPKRIDNLSAVIILEDFLMVSESDKL